MPATLSPALPLAPPSKKPLPILYQLRASWKGLNAAAAAVAAQSGPSPGPDVGARQAQKRFRTERRRRDQGKIPFQIAASNPAVCCRDLSVLRSSVTPAKAPTTARCLRDLRRSSASRPVPPTIIARKAATNEIDAPFLSSLSLISPQF